MNFTKIFSDFGNFIANKDDYKLLSEHQEEIDRLYSDFEQMILNAEDTQEELKARTMKIYEKLARTIPPLYRETFMKRSLDRLGNLAEHAKIQRTVTDFFELEVDSSKFPVEIIGKPERLQLKVFMKRNNRLYIQNVKFPNFEIFEICSKNPINEVNAKLDIQIERIESWNGDYGKLADRVLEQKRNPDYSIMLINIPLGTSEQLAAPMIGYSYIPMYIEESKRKEE